MDVLAKSGGTNLDLYTEGFDNWNMLQVCLRTGSSVVVNITQKVGKCVFGRFFLCCNNASWK